MKKILLLITPVMLVLGLRADIKVSDVEVFSGYPWKEVVVGYTITGRVVEDEFIRLTATDKTANKSYTVETGASTLTGADLSEGRHLMRWKTVAEGVRFSSTNVVFSVSVVSYYGGVQLWEDGPYWAECNIGATKPEEYGYYFWWGDTVGYKRNAANNGWESVKDGSSFSFDSSSCPTYGKDNSQLRSAGYIDATGNLTAAHDAATAHLGAPWRMPTDAEFNALLNDCIPAFKTRNGVYGLLVTGTGIYASKSIFLPLAGVGNDSALNHLGSYCYNWSSTPDSDDTRYAWYADIRSLSYLDYVIRQSNYYRYLGQSVRPVRGRAH